MGMDMLQARLGKVKVNEAEIKNYVSDISVTPLAIPMICGPGALTNAIVLMELQNDFSSIYKIENSLLYPLCHRYRYLYSTDNVIALGNSCINVEEMVILPLNKNIQSIEDFPVTQTVNSMKIH